MCVWVVGDAVVNGGETGTSFRQALVFIEAGWLLHDTMIYEKNGSAYPASAKSNRYSQIFEFMFVFSKGKPKTHNLIKDKPNRWAGHTTFGDNSERKKDGSLKAKKKKGDIVIAEYGYRNNIWRINNGYGYSTKDKIAFEHPAIFPEVLVKDHITTWTNPGDLCYDCFMGSGTTAKMAYLTGRNFIGSEISEEYCRIANKRLSDYSTQLSETQELG